MTDVGHRRRADLNTIVHPRVRSAGAGWCADFERRPAYRFAIVTIPLFFESARATGLFDRAVVTAWAHSAQARAGVQPQRGRAPPAPAPEEDAPDRLRDTTDGTLTDTDRQVDAIFGRIDALSVA